MNQREDLPANRLVPSGKRQIGQLIIATFMLSLAIPSRFENTWYFGLYSWILGLTYGPALLFDHFGIPWYESVVFGLSALLSAICNFYMLSFARRLIRNFEVPNRMGIYFWVGLSCGVIAGIFHGARSLQSIGYWLWLLAYLECLAFLHKPVILNKLINRALAARNSERSPD